MNMKIRRQDIVQTNNFIGIDLLHIYFQALFSVLHISQFRDVWDVWLKAKTTKECQVSIEDLIPGSRSVCKNFKHFNAIFFLII